jgi:integrase
MKQAVFVRHKRERNVYHVVWFEQGRERTRSYPTRQEAEQEKQRRLELLAQGHAPEPFDLLPPHEKRELFALQERALAKGYNPWDALRTHEKFLESEQTQGIEIGEAVAMCLQDKEAEGDSARTLQSLRSVLLRFAARKSGKLLGEIETADAIAFVDGLDISLRTRLGYLSDLRTLFSWGLQKGLVEVNPVVAAMPGRATRKRIMLAKRSRRKEQVLSVEECEKLIRWVERNDQGLLVYPVLCLFAGLRPELEATGIDWGDVRLEHITVDASIAKDGETRIIEPLTPNLVEWISAISDSCKSPLPLRNLRRRWERASSLSDLNQRHFQRWQS